MRKLSAVSPGTLLCLPTAFLIGVMAICLTSRSSGNGNIFIILFIPFSMMCVILFLRRPTPTLFLATALAAFGLFGSLLWDWGRQGTHRWSGLPLTYGLSTVESSRTRILFFISAATCLCTALLLPRPTTSGGRWPKVAAGQLPRLSRSAVPLNLAVMAFYLAGQGTSLIERDVYLQSNGIGWLLRVAVGLLIPVLTVNFLLMLSPIPHIRRIVIMTLQALWSLLLASAGTRIAIISLALLATGILISSRGPTRITGFVLSTAAAMASMTWVHAARESTHGIGPLLSDLVSGRLLATLQPDNVMSALQGMAASVGAAFPITAMSADRPVPLPVVWTLANPFPRDLLSSGSVDVATRDFGVLTPLTWVPRSTIGMMWSAGSWWLLIAVWALTCLSLWLADRWLSMVPYGRMASYGFTLLIFVGSLQYGIRQQMRVLTIAVALGAICWTQRDRFRTDGELVADTDPESSVEVRSPTRL